LRFIHLNLSVFVKKVGTQAIVASRMVLLHYRFIHTTGLVPLATDKDCVDYARDCVRLAGMAGDPEVRDGLLQLAREWMAAAMHEEKAPGARSPKFHSNAS
jgi:hypothetical protein